MLQSAKRPWLSMVPDTSGSTPARLKTVRAQGIPAMAAASTPEFLRDSYAATTFAEVVDRSLHAAMARFTVGVSPMTLIGAYADWAAHLYYSPGKRLQLGEKALSAAIPRFHVQDTERLSESSRKPHISFWRLVLRDILIQSNSIGGN